MRVRQLGQTGIEVSACCLGTVVFGKMGNPGHDDCGRRAMAWSAVRSAVEALRTGGGLSAVSQQFVAGDRRRPARAVTASASAVLAPQQSGDASLLEPQASFITGTDLLVDDGVVAASRALVTVG